jgi:hypothetical protein
MPNADVTKTCLVYKDATFISPTPTGRASVQVEVKAGGEYDLPWWWYEPLRRLGALTPPGKAAPPPWEDLNIGPAEWPKQDTNTTGGEE